MRNGLSAGLIRCIEDPRFVFLTGDLGYGALEPLQEALGERFVNAGIAEQNMVSVAAGLARAGLRPWVYSIAPFVYARPFEQIRNDICLHNLPVKLVGNGGGYAYGVMGATHHALEDYGSLLTLNNMHAYVPAFGSDVEPVIARLADSCFPAYLRLGRCEKPESLELPAYAPWRKLLDGGGPTMAIIGPLAGGIIEEMMTLEEGLRPEIWVISELPIDSNSIPRDFLNSVSRSGHLFVIEEHVSSGGLGQKLAHCLLESGNAPAHFTHRCAVGYPSGTYGSQRFHRRECKLDPKSIAQTVQELSRSRSVSYRLRTA